MSVWIISSEDGDELGRSTAIHAKTAFLIWYDPPPTRPGEIETSPLPDDACRITYHDQVFILKKE